MSDYVLTKPELRSVKASRTDFAGQPRNPIILILDGVRNGYNVGSIFRLCDAFLIERLVICGTPPVLRKRKLVAAAAGTQRWVPWKSADTAADAVQAAKAAGYWVAAIELTAFSVSVDAMRPKFPAALVLGGETRGVSSDALALADQAVAIPMMGMANSLNVATAAAIVLHELVKCHGNHN